MNTSSSSSPHPRPLKRTPKPPSHSKWKTPTQQQTYTNHLLNSLHNSSSPSTPLTIKNTANTALALTARGQSRWSRAILLSRKQVHLKACTKVLRRRKRQPKPPPLQAKVGLKGHEVKDRIHKLGRIVPGCRKLSVPSLLEETADYVAALQMQVKTMRVLADALTGLNLSDG